MGTAVHMVLVLCFMLFGQTLTISNPDLQQRLRDLDTFIQTLMTCESRPVVGLTVSVVKDGESIFAKGYGQRDLLTGQAVDNTTLFGVGSISKSFTTALLAAILGEREDVGWDTVLTDILGPDFSFRDQFRTKEATLRDILAHKTGIENQKLALRVVQDFDRSELARRIRYFRQIYPFRTVWHYNNALYTLAGHVAEKLTGKSYEALLRERVLGPLGMDDTVYLADVLDDEDFSNLAQTYLTYNRTGQSVAYSHEEFRPLKLHLPAGGVVSNALDMARYMNFQLSGGRDAAGRLVVPEDTLRQTHVAELPSKFNPNKLEPDWPVEAGTEQGYGLAWFVGTYRGYRRLQHNGFVAGYTSLLSLYPAASGGVFTSVNGPNAAGIDVHEIIHDLVGDIVTGKDHWLNDTTACTYPEPWLTRPKPNSTDLPEISDNFPRDKRDYEGVYGNRVAGNLTISLNTTDGNLYFSLGLIGRGLVLPSTSPTRILLRAGEPLVYTPNIVADVEEKDGDVFSLSVESYAPEPPIVFERGLKLTDPDPTEPKWDDCTGVSGTPNRAASSNIFMILILLALFTT
ncbi:PREDICTED: beta-lactamase-like protein 3 [Branchiostoma belcheri]|uniref:Beta-lactamase-like protein 3 n=1 Tax=Branchiostoma belcheri TaxID=7741 RepID=A0A6P4YXS5_BRABE|nr:PREDICTED: beta-lactamase-like protein 3 [Branchiostoma belcheri]